MPVSVTTGEAQKGHSRAWRSASNSISAPQLSHRTIRVSSISAGGSDAALRRSRTGIGPRFSGIGASVPQWAQRVTVVPGTKRRSAPQAGQGKRWVSSAEPASGRGGAGGAGGGSGERRRPQGPRFGAGGGGGGGASVTARPALGIGCREGRPRVKTPSSH